MGLGTNHVTVTTGATFIPEVWSDEIVATYKKSLVAANLIKKMSFKAKKVTPFIFQCPHVVVLLLRQLRLKSH